MALIEHYAALRALHIGAVALSGTLFATRALSRLAGASWPLAWPARVASWVVDTALLAAGASLWAALQLHPLQQTWLAAKLVLLVLYIGLGTMALRRARTPASRLAWTLAALTCLAFIVSVAVLRQPLGWWAGA
jgi:uncharacterized membrane protein SirB2